MITSRIKIFVDNNELDFDNRRNEANENFKFTGVTVVANTSSNGLGDLCMGGFNRQGRH